MSWYALKSSVAHRVKSLNGGGEVGEDWLCRPESASVVAKEVVGDWNCFFPGCKAEVEHFLNMGIEPWVFSSAEVLSLDVSARRIGQPANYDDSLAFIELYDIHVIIIRVFGGDFSLFNCVL